MAIRSWGVAIACSMPLRHASEKKEIDVTNVTSEPADRSQCDLSAFLGRGIAGIDHYGTGQCLLATMVGVVTGSHLGNEVHDTLGMQAVRWDVGMQRRRKASSFSVQMFRLRCRIIGRTPLDAGATVGAVKGHIALIFRDPLRPTGLQQQCPAILQSQEGGREILDIEGACCDSVLRMYDELPLPRGPNSAYVAAVTARTGGSSSR